MKTFEDYKELIINSHNREKAIMEFVEKALDENIHISSFVNTAMELGYVVRMSFVEIPKEVQDVT